jgi:hypothetical protein
MRLSTITFSWEISSWTINYKIWLHSRELRVSLDATVEINWGLIWAENVFASRNLHLLVERDLLSIFPIRLILIFGSWQRILCVVQDRVLEWVLGAKLIYTKIRLRILPRTPSPTFVHQWAKNFAISCISTRLASILHPLRSPACRFLPLSKYFLIDFFAISLCPL